MPVISNSDACMNYYNKVSTSTNPRATGMYAYYTFQDLGFALKKASSIKIITKGVLVEMMMDI